MCIRDSLRGLQRTRLLGRRECPLILVQSHTGSLSVNLSDLVRSSVILNVSFYRMVTNKSTLKQDLVNHQVPMTTYDDLTLLYTDTQHFSDVLISSYLYKKQGSTTAPNKLGIDNKSTTAGVSGPSDTANSHHWFAKGGFHSYWCVLRRGQFSYYKDKSERKPVDVIPADQILEFRYLEEEHRLDFYANHKTLSFWSESNEVLRSWNTALQEFVADRRRASLPMKLYDSENEEVDNESEYDDDDDFEILSEVARPRNGQSKDCLLYTSRCV